MKDDVRIEIHMSRPLKRELEQLSEKYELTLASYIRFVLASHTRGELGGQVDPQSVIKRHRAKRGKPE
jgi:hypothetical protein